MTSRIIEMSPEEVEPTQEALLTALGVPVDREQGERVRDVLAQALDELRTTAEPRGVFAWVDVPTFASVYEGNGDNDVPSPLAGIFPRAERLALFAATVGGPLSERIASLFDEGQLALGAALDAAASAATELTGMRLDVVALEEARREGWSSADSRAMRYSPGYCGWNITGQRALFTALGPDSIGVTLNESFLMEPLKSISGVIVIAPPPVHNFQNDYGFCSGCANKECRERIAGLNENRGPQ